MSIKLKTKIMGGLGGIGDVVGPASSTDNALVRFDGATGKLIQNSTVLVSDTTGAMTFQAASGANLLWNTDAAGDIGASYANRPNSIYAKTQAIIASETSNTIFNAQSASATSGQRGFFQLSRSRGTFTTPAFVNSGDQLGTILWSTYDGAGTINSRSVGAISYSADETHTGSTAGTRIDIQHVLSGSTAVSNAMTFRGNSSVRSVSLNCGTLTQTQSGSTPPQHQMINDSSTATTVGLDVRMYGTGSGRYANTKTRGTLAAATPLLSGDVVGTFEAITNDASGGAPGTARTMARMYMMATENHTSGSAIGSKILFAAVPNGSTTLTNRFQIDSDVQLVGTTNLLWNTDAAGNIGATGTNRPNNIFVKTSLKVEAGNAEAQQFLANTGTAIAPAFTFNGDSSNGIYSPAVSELAITTNGTQRVWVGSTGIVKINSLTASRVIVTNLSNELTSSSVTDTELGYVSGVTSAIQIQLNAKAPSASPTFSGTITTPLTASRAVVTGASSELAASATTSTEIGYVSGVTSAIQTQLDSKIASGGRLKLNRTTVADADYTVLTSDYYVGLTSITVTRTFTLPAAATAGAGSIIVVKDESGSVSGTVKLIVDGNAAETIDGATTFEMTSAYESLNLMCTGTGWAVI